MAVGIEELLDLIQETEEERQARLRLQKVPGGKESLLDENRIKGVYAQHPAGTPKYHPGNVPDSVGRQARMFIQVQNNRAYKDYIALLKGRAKSIARVLASTDPRAKGGTQTGYGYVDFLLQQFSYQNQEKHQVVEMLSDAYVSYFFGQAAPRVSLSGVVMNTRQDDWYDAWNILYQDLIRGTHLARRNQILILRVDTRLYYLAPVANSESLEAQTETAGRFGMQALVKKVVIFNDSYVNTAPTDLRKLGLSSQALAAPLTSSIEVFQIQGERENETTEAEIVFTEDEVLVEMVAASSTAVNPSTGQAGSAIIFDPAE